MPFCFDVARTWAMDDRVALRAAGVAPEGERAMTRALGTLADTGMIVERSAA